MNYFHELQTALAGIDPTPLLDFVRDCEGTLWIAGNGGSASIAQHWACDLSKAAGRRVQALGSNPAVLTAWANDSSYADALSMELDRLARPGDRLIALSCSGTSPNIKDVLCHDMPCALLTGSHLAGGAYADLILYIPHAHYGVIEDCFGAIGHWLTEELR